MDTTCKAEKLLEHQLCNCAAHLYVALYSALYIVFDSCLSTRQILILFGLDCQLQTHPHMLSFLRSGCMTLSY